MFFRFCLDTKAEQKIKAAEALLENYGSLRCENELAHKSKNIFGFCWAQTAFSLIATLSLFSYAILLRPE